MTYNFPDHKKGDTFNGVQFTVLVNNVAFNIVNAEIKLKLRKTAQANPVKTMAVGTGITITNGASGVFKVDEQIIDIEAATYLYDIQIKTVGGVVKTYISGTWKIMQDIS